MLTAVVVSTPPGGGGLTNGAVARRLSTVNAHLRRVFAKLGVPNRVAQAAVYITRSS